MVITSMIKVKNLKLKQWEQIKKASFPNQNNVLYKKHILRPEGYSNRFNKTNYEQLKTIGFQKGENNWSTRNRKGKTRSIEDRKGMIYRGHWVKWDIEEMEKIKSKMIEALVNNNNVRLKAAQEMGISRNLFYSYMKRIDSVDWNKEYPYPKAKASNITNIREVFYSKKKTMKKMMDKGHIPFSNLTQEQKDLRLKNFKSIEEKKKQKKG